MIKTKAKKIIDKLNEQLAQYKDIYYKLEMLLEHKEELKGVLNFNAIIRNKHQYFQIITLLELQKHNCIINVIPLCENKKQAKKYIDELIEYDVKNLLKHEKGLRHE